MVVEKRPVFPIIANPRGNRTINTCREELAVEVIPVSREPDNCIEKIEDGLYVECGGSGEPGPPGPPGPQGTPGKDGQIRYTGHGAPGVIVGANPNDTYLDLDTGDIYKLT